MNSNTKKPTLTPHPIDAADAGREGVAGAGVVLGLADAIFVGRRVVEAQRIARAQLEVHRLPAAGVEHRGDALARRQDVVMPAVGADPEVLRRTRR
jgi:hypothetical protein